MKFETGLTVCLTGICGPSYRRRRAGRHPLESGVPHLQVQPEAGQHGQIPGRTVQLSHGRVIRHIQGICT